MCDTSLSSLNICVLRRNSSVFIYIAKHISISCWPILVQARKFFHI